MIRTLKKLVVAFAVTGDLWASSPQLDDFVHSVETRTRKHVYIVTPSEGTMVVSKGGLGKEGIYAILRPGASDAEIVHEVLHGVLNIEGYVATTNNNEDRWTGQLSGNLQDFILHPLLDERARQAGFPQDKGAEAHAAWFLNYLRTRAADINEKTEYNRIGIAANAMGIAEVLQDNFGPIQEIRTWSLNRLPIAFSLAQEVLRAFPQRKYLSIAESYDFAKSLLGFLDRQTSQYAGNPPSSAIRILNPKVEAPLDRQKESVIQAYIKNAQAHSKSGK